MEEFFTCLLANALLPRAEGAKIFAGDRSYVVEQFENHPTHRHTTDGDVEKASRSLFDAHFFHLK
jgi:hypothetical protein